MTTHRVHISGGGPYSVQYAGRTIVADTATPVHCAASYLKAQGAHDRDRLKSMFGGCSIMPATIGAILRPRAPLRASDIKRMLANS